MAGAFSQDLRERVIDAVLRDGMSRRAAAERFGVSESAAIKWVERVERSGSRTAAQMGGYKPLKLEPHREFVEALHDASGRIAATRLRPFVSIPSQGSVELGFEKLLNEAANARSHPGFQGIEPIIAKKCSPSKEPASGFVLSIVMA